MNISEFDRLLTQSIAITIYHMGITKQPILRFFKDGTNAILTPFITMHLNNRDIENIKQQDKMTYLMLMGCHALGAGGYVTLCQNKYGKAAGDFNFQECAEILQDFNNTDAYELFLNTMGIKADSGNKQCLDQIVRVAGRTTEQLVGDTILQEEYLTTYMRVLFNAGITIVMR